MNHTDIDLDSLRIQVDKLQGATIAAKAMSYSKNAQSVFIQQIRQANHRINELLAEPELGTMSELIIAKHETDTH